LVIIVIQFPIDANRAVIRLVMYEDQSPNIPMRGGGVGEPSENPGRDGGADPPPKHAFNRKIIPSTKNVSRLGVPPFPPFEFGLIAGG
jgi:hypothetical protein